MKKPLKIISNTLYFTTFTVLIVLTIMVISSRASGGEPELFGYQIKTVLSGSMEPTFQTGSIIATKALDDKTTLKVNDIITYKEDEQNIVTHRIIDVIKNGDSIMYKTKGDNNEDEDTNPVLSENVVAKYTGFTIPFIGYFLDFASKPIGTAILLIVPGLLLLIYSSLTIWQAIKEIEARTKLVDSNKNSASV